MSTKEQISRYKANNLCVNCLKPLEPDRVGLTICSKCSKKRVEGIRSDREFYISMGVCPRCKQNKLFGSERSCIECKAKDAAKKEKQRSENREAYNERMKQYQKTQYMLRKQEGICTRCGKRKAVEGRTRCLYCSSKNQTGLTASYYGSDRVAKGLCYWCGKPAKSGYKVCEEHYQASVEKSKLASKEERAKGNKSLFYRK